MKVMLDIAEFMSLEKALLSHSMNKCDIQVFGQHDTTVTYLFQKERIKIYAYSMTDEQLSLLRLALSSFSRSAMEVEVPHHNHDYVSVVTSNKYLFMRHSAYESISFGVNTVHLYTQHMSDVLKWMLTEQPPLLFNRHAFLLTEQDNRTMMKTLSHVLLNWFKGHDVYAEIFQGKDVEEVLDDFFDTVHLYVHIDTQGQPVKLDSGLFRTILRYPCLEHGHIYGSQVDLLEVDMKWQLHLE